MLLTHSDDLIDPFFHPATANRFAGPLAANCSSAIRNRDDRQRLRPASIVLLELPPYTFYPRDHLLAHYIDPCREIGKAACRLFHQPDLGVHTLRLALHCGRVRPLPPT